MLDISYNHAEHNKARIDAFERLNHLKNQAVILSDLLDDTLIQLDHAVDEYKRLCQLSDQFHQK